MVVLSILLFITFLEEVTTLLGMLLLPLLLFRGYRAYNPATGEALDLFYGENNTVCVEIPVGFNGQVWVRHVPLWYWRVAEAVTLLGYGVWIWRCKVRKK